MLLKVKQSEVLAQQGVNAWLKQLSYKAFALITEANKSQSNYDQGGQLIYASVYSDQSCNNRMWSNADAAMDALPLSLANDLLNEILEFNGVKQANVDEQAI